MRRSRPTERTGRNTDRGQAFTLEGVSAAILILMALLYAQQAVVLTPTTPGTIDRETRAELATQGHDVMIAAHDNRTLSWTVRYWNTTLPAPNRTFYNYDPDTVTVDPTYGYGNDDAPRLFGAMLNQTFQQRGLSLNVYVEYRRTADPTDTDRITLLSRGEPTDNAVSVEYPLALYDDQQITAPATNKTLAETSKYFADDIDPDGPLYNVVVVRLVIW